MRNLLLLLTIIEMAEISFPRCTSPPKNFWVLNSLHIQRAICQIQSISCPFSFFFLPSPSGKAQPTSLIIRSYLSSSLLSLLSYSLILFQPHHSPSRKLARGSCFTCAASPTSNASSLLQIYLVHLPLFHSTLFLGDKIRTLQSTDFSYHTTERSAALILSVCTITC